MNINPREIIDRKIVKIAKNTSIQQVGIDLTVEKEIRLYHNEFINSLVNEEVNIPTDLFALIFSRSSFNRIGVVIRGVVLDPGYNGRPSISIYNLSNKRITIPKDTRLIQILFFKADPANLYQGQYQREGL